MSQDDQIFDVEPNADAAGARRPCPMCGEMIAVSAKVCRFCGHWLDPSARPRSTASTTDQLLLPVNRPAIAIIAGYLGLFALIPFFAPVALIVSIFALRTLKQNPDMAGRGRAWFGLVMGVLFTLAYGIGLAVAVMNP